MRQISPRSVRCPSRIAVIKLDANRGKQKPPTSLRAAFGVPPHGRQGSDFFMAFLTAKCHLQRLRTVVLGGKTDSMLTRIVELGVRESIGTRMVRRLLRSSVGGCKDQRSLHKLKTV